MGGEGSVARRVLFFCSWCPFVLSFSYARAARRPSPPRVPARVSLTVNKCALPPSCPLRRPALVASSRARLPARLLWRHNVHVGCIPFAYGVAGSDRAGVAERAGVDTWGRKGGEARQRLLRGRGVAEGAGNEQGRGGGGGGVGGSGGVGDGSGHDMALRRRFCRGTSCTGHPSVLFSPHCTTHTPRPAPPPPPNNVAYPWRSRPCSWNFLRT